jgi:hypothetical protein
MSSNSSTLSPGQPVSEKLTCDNFILWKAQIIPIMRGAQLFGYLDETIVEPAKTDVAAHALWVAQDQHVLQFINASLSQEVLGHVVTYTTSVGVWIELTAMFVSQSRARTIQLRTCLAMMCKGNQSAAVYYNKMEGFTNEMTAAGKPLEGDDFISYVLAALDHDYNSFVENVACKTEISLGTILAVSCC